MTEVVAFRAATRDDVVLLERWDRDPTVLAAHSDTATEPDSDWPEEFDFIDTYGPDVWELLIATVGGEAGRAAGESRDVGVVRIMDPLLEPSGYWHPVDANLRALDIWIGEPDARGQGYGTQMMTAALDRCFRPPSVAAVVIDPLRSNVDAHRFYARLGFVTVGPRRFGDDDCLVMRIDRDVWHTMPR